MSADGQAKTGAGLFAALGGISAVAYAAVPFVVRSDNSTSDFLRFFSIFFGLACVWGLALWLAGRVAPSRGLVLAGAVLFRLAILPAGMDFESGGFQRQLLYDDDVWRYLWEGHAWSAGVNPLHTAPAQLEEYDLEQRDPALARRLYSSPKWSNVFDNIGYRDVASAYPIGAQALFRLAEAVAPASVPAWKLIVLAFDLGAVWLLASMAGGGARGSMALVAYAWNPLVVKEFAGSGHVDAALVFLLLAAAALAGSRGGWLVGAAALVKPIALLFVPAMVKRSGWRALAGPAVALGAMAWLPPEGLAAYAQSWTFNAAILRLLPGERWAGMAAGAAAVLAVIVWQSRRDDGSREALWRHAVWVFGAFLLMTPMFAPWYLTWLLPFAALGLSWFWLGLSGSIFLAYHANLSFQEIPALAALEFAMPLLLWVWMSRRTAIPAPEDGIADRKGIVQLASIVGFAGGLCCVTPVVAVMIGLASVSTAAAFGNIMYGDYRWAFRLFGFAVLAVALIRYFRKHGVCTLDQAKRRRNWIVNVTLLATTGSAAVYVFWTYVVVHYWGIAAGLPWAQYDESWAIPLSAVLAAATATLFLTLRRGARGGS